MTFEEWWETTGLGLRSTRAVARMGWNAAQAAAFEESAKDVEAEHVGASVDDECDNEGDRAYNLALRHAARAIRARIENHL